MTCVCTCLCTYGSQRLTLSFFPGLFPIFYIYSGFPLSLKLAGLPRLAGNKDPLFLIFPSVSSQQRGYRHASPLCLTFYIVSGEPSLGLCSHVADILPSPTLMHDTNPEETRTDTCWPKIGNQ